MSPNAHSNDPAPDSGASERSLYKSVDRRVTVLETRFDTVLPTLATKADLEGLRREVEIGLKKLRGEVGAGMENLRGELHSELAKLRGDMFTALHDAMRWMIGIMVTMFIGLLGANFALFNAVKGLIESTRTAAPSVDRPLAPRSLPEKPSPIDQR